MPDVRAASAITSQGYLDEYCAKKAMQPVLSAAAPHFYNSEMPTVNGSGDEVTIH